MQALMLYVEMHGRDMVEFLDSELSKQKEDIADRIEQLEIHRAVLENFKRKSSGDIFSSMKQLNEKCAEIQDILTEDMKNFFVFTPDKSFPELGMFIPARLEKPQLLDKPKSKLLSKPVWLKTLSKPSCEHIPSYYAIASITALSDNLLACLLCGADDSHVCIVSMESGSTVHCIQPVQSIDAVYPGASPPATSLLLLSPNHIEVVPFDISASTGAAAAAATGSTTTTIEITNKYSKPFTGCCALPGQRLVATVAEENLVVIYMLPSGQVQREFSVCLGETDSRVHEPRAVLYTSRRELLLHDTADDALYRFSDDGLYMGALLDEAGTKKKFIGTYSDARMVEGSLANVLVMEKYNRKVNLFSSEGRFLRNLFPEYDNKDDLPNQEGVAITPSGQLLLAMQDRIECYQLYD